MRHSSLHRLPGGNLLETGILVGFVLLVLGVLFGGESAQAEEAPVIERERTIYMELKPTFVTNFGPVESRKLMYVKTDINLSLNGSDAEDAAMYHLPALRHEVVMLLSKQNEEALSTAPGRDQVLGAVLDSLNQVFEREEGKPMVKEVMFTNLLLQR